MHEERILDCPVVDSSQQLNISSTFTISAEMNEVESEAFKDIIRYVKDIEDDIRLFTILGSYRDMSVSRGWSDVDAFMVVKDEALIDRSRVRRLRDCAITINKRFRDICPLQHHGVISISEHEMQNYSSHIMPLTVLESSSSLLIDKPLLFKMSKEMHRRTIKGMKGRLQYLYEAQKTGVFMHHPYKGEGLYIEEIASRGGMYQLFCLMGYVMTVPSYFLDAIGQSCLKEESFVNIKKFIPESDLSIVSLFSKIRNEWSELEGHSYTPNQVPKWILEQLQEKWFDRCVSLLETCINTACKINERYE